MAKTIFDPQHRRELGDRLAQLTPHSQRRWGKMNAPQMICHLQDSLQIGTGRVPARARRSFLGNPVVRWLVIYALPWPKGKAKTVSEMLATKPSDWQADVTRLGELLESAAALGPRGKWAAHPTFGELSGTQYGHLIYKHFNHHLTQFGV